MMPQPDNTDIVTHFLISTLDVVSRRSSESYAVVAIKTVIDKIREKHLPLEHIQIKSTEYAETIELVKINPGINAFSKDQIGLALKSILEELIKSIGKAADFYFLRELKEEVGSTYEPIIVGLGIDLDFMQFQYLIQRKDQGPEKIQNTDIFKRVINVLMDILKDKKSQQESLKSMTELINRLSTKYPFLKYITINDVRFTQSNDIVAVSEEINAMKKGEIAEVLNRIFSEITKGLGKIVNTEVFIQKLQDRLTQPYVIKLEEIGVNLNVLMRLRHELIFKHVFRAIIEVLSKASTASYAVLSIDNAIKNINTKYDFLKFIKIDSTRYSDGVDSISIMTKIEEISSIDAGKSIQKLIEELIKLLGDEAGQNLIKNFKKQLGNTYLVRIEEMGVNLHMIELRQNLIW